MDFHIYENLAERGTSGKLQGPTVSLLWFKNKYEQMEREF